MKYRQWKKNSKKKHGVNPPLELDKRKQRRLAIGDNMFRYDAASGVNSLEVSIFYSKEFLGV